MRDINIKIQLAMRWNKTKECRPQYYTEVLVKTKSGKIRACWLASDGDNDIYTICDTDIIINEEVVEWCVLGKVDTDSGQLTIPVVVNPVCHICDEPYWYNTKDGEYERQCDC